MCRTKNDGHNPLNMPATANDDLLATRQPGSRLRERAMYFGPGVALGLVLLMLWGFVIWFALVYPKNLLDDQRRDLAESTKAAVLQTEALLRDAENSLRTVDLWLLTRRQDDPLGDVSLAQLTEILRETSRGLVDVMLVREDGQLIRIPSVAGQPPSDVKGQVFFRQLAGPGTEKMLLGTPLRLSAGAPLLLPLAMRLSAPAGGLRQAVALIDLQKLGEAHANYARGLTGAVAMLRNDGVALSRSPELPGFVGQDVFAKWPERRADFIEREGFFITDGNASDGIRRQGAYRRLDGFGVMLLISQGENASLAGYFQQRRWVLLLSTLISAAALGATAVLSRLQRATRLRDAALLATSNASPLGLYRCDAQGRVSYANEAYRRLFNLAADDEIAWGWLAYVPEGERARRQSDWRARMTRAEPLNLVWRMQGPDGASMQVSLRTAPLLVDGRLVGHAGTVEDITERMAQRKAEQTLAAIFDMTPDYVCRIDMQGRLLYLNPAARRRLNLAPDASLAGLTQMNYYTAARMARFRSEILPTALRDGHWHGRSGVLGPDGIEIPIDSTVLVHRDPQSDAATISLIMRDISDELLALRERQRSEAMMLAVAQSAQAMIAVADARQCFLFFNDTFAEQFNTSGAAWMGRPVRELLGRAEYVRCQPFIEAALRGDRQLHEIRFEREGAPLIVEAQFTPLLPASGEIEGVICLARDVTVARLEASRLRRASQTDPLTGLLNRSGFALGFDEQLAQGRQHNNLIGLLYLDLDRFKPVNDQHGHPVGDALLKAVAGRLRHTLRPQDLVARLGGDEFAVLLFDLLKADDADLVAQKLVRAIGKPFRIDDLQLAIGVSIGFCVVPGGAADMDAMVAQADAKLYEAKRAGRGRSLGVTLIAA